MSEVLRFPDIFKEFISVQEIIRTKEKPFLSEALSLLSSLKKYFDSGVWARSETEYLIYTRCELPYTTSEMADLLGLKDTTYRSMLSRLSDRIRSVALNGVTISDVVFSQDAKYILDTKRRVDFLYEEYDPYKNLPRELILEMESILKSAKGKAISDKVVEDRDLFDAMNVLSRFSISNMKKQFASIDPAVWVKAFSELNKGEYTAGLGYLRFCDSGNATLRQIKEDSFKNVQEKLRKNGVIE